MRYFPPEPANSLHSSSGSAVSRRYSPTARDRSVATRRNIVARAVSPFATRATGTGPVAVHGRCALDGTTNVTEVLDAEVTAAETPFSSTSLSATAVPKFVPVIEPVPPGTSVTDDVPVMLGVLRLRTRRLTESVLPSAEARMNVLPGVTPVTTPLCVMVASAGFADDQETARPVIGIPSAFCGCAVNVTVSPGRTLGVRGVMAMKKIGCSVTVSGRLPTTASTVALMVTEPGAAAVTRPEVLTDAIDELLEA